MENVKGATSVFAEARRTGPGVSLQIDHAHEEIEFNLIIAGKGTYFLADGQYDLAPGTLVWLLPHQPHRLLRPPDFDMWVVTFPPAELDRALLDDVAEHPCRTLSAEDAIALNRLLVQVSQDTDEPRLYRSGLEYVLRSAWRATMTSPGPARKPLHPAVLNALSILRSNSETPTSAALAKMCGVTQDYLGQLLMEQTGKGFVEWRNRTRMERFHVLYPESGDLLTAALDAGFGSYTQFHRVFSDVMGTTPGEWAKAGGQNNSVALPSTSDVITDVEGEGTRSVWYSLCGTAFPAVVRRFENGQFARAFGAGDPDDSANQIFPSGVGALDDLRGFEQALIDELEADCLHAEQLARMFQSHDVFKYYEGTLGAYGYACDDLANILGMYLGCSWIAVQQAPALTRKVLDHVIPRVRYALSVSEAFHEVSAQERALVSAGLIAQSIFIRNSMVGARSAGNEKVAAQVADRAHSCALQSTGLDLRAMRIAPRHLD